MSRRSMFALAAATLALVLVVVLIGRRAPSAPEGPGVVEIGGDTLLVAGVPAAVAAFLEEGRSWRAARALDDHLRGSGRRGAPELVLLAARAEAEWGGWAAVLRYLDDQPWLDEAQGGEGWYWLARAREVGADDPGALGAYDRYLELQDDASGAPRARTATLRRALVLMRLGERERGVAALAPLREGETGLATWLDLLSAESFAEAGDTAAVRTAIEGLPVAAGVRHRGRMAAVRAYEAAGDRQGAVRTALAFRGSGGTATQQAELAAAAGRLLLEAQDLAGARRELRAAIDLAPGSGGARNAADLLFGVPGPTAAERLAIADVDARTGNVERAISGYRAWLGSGAGSPAERVDVQLRLGRALFAAGNDTGAEETLRPLHSGTPAVAREALFLTGRAQYRRGANAAAFSTFDQLARRFPGSTEGSEALYLVADLQHDGGDAASAAPVYQRVVDEFRGTDRAGLALMRLAGMRYLARDFPGAAATWAEYRNAYPTGQRWLEATYWVARSREQMGDAAGARPLYEAIRQRDPLSYYAVLASDRLGVPYWPIPMDASPAVDEAARSRVAGWMEVVDLLRDAGLAAEADAEAQRLSERTDLDVPTRYSLAEALNERGYALRGIRIGQQLEGSGRPNPRLLRILYPFPYRALVEAEAVEKNLDPFVVAALTRQESLFTARISSPVGARGLMQVMPQTGAEVARGAQIPDWDPELLFEPEINVHLGTLYLAEQMERYDADLPSVFSAYNAGPHRIDVWKEFPEYGDRELFTERIPFRETRDYVKILSRNIELYRGLYGAAEGAAPP